MQELEDFSEEQQADELLRTNEGLVNSHKTEKQLWIIQEMIHSIKIQGYVKFWGHFYKLIYYFALWSICKSICISVM